MDWFADLAGKAENILTSLDESTGAALRNQNPAKARKSDGISNTEPVWKKTLSSLPRSPKKYTAASETKSIYFAPKKSSVPFHPTRSMTKETPEKKEKCYKNKSPPRKMQHYTLNHCPKTMVGDIKEDDEFGLRRRRHTSLPEDLDLIHTESFTYRMQNLEVENAMLKNELNVMNREVSDLLDRLHKAEDGNTIVNGFTDQKDTRSRLEDVQIVKHQLCAEKENLSSQLAQLRQKIHDVTVTEVTKFKEQNARLDIEVKLLTDRNNDLEDKIRELTEKNHEKDQSHTKVENDLRHAQTTISDLQNDLERSKAECVRLEREWETYKLRVKSMLHAKDNEIKSLQEGMNLTEDTKILIEQLDSLKEEREILSESILRVRNECDNMRQHIDQLESRHNSAERVVSALREALRDERAAKNRTEAQCIAMGKELKSIQIETGQTIANLRTALREKENELLRIRETPSVSTTAPSALNVGDYDVMQETIDNDKIHYLTNTLVQKQGKIDALMADNNMLKIQMDKLQAKYKAEVLHQNKHSVVQVSEPRRRPASALSRLSLRAGVALKRYPVFRVFILVYMVGLHFWVLTVLLTSTPESNISRNSRS